MSFYQLMSAQYGNRRTFAPESEGTPGGVSDANAGEGDAAAAAVAAAANPDPKAGDEAGQGGDDGKAKQAQVKAEAKTDDEKASLLREVMDKKSKLKDAEDRLKSFDGIDPAKYRELVAKEAEAERADAEKKGDFDRVKAMMADAHATEKKTLEDQITELKGQLTAAGGVIEELTVGNTFGNSAFINKNLILSPAKTRILYGSHFESEDGAVVGYDKPRGAADRTKLVNASGSALPFDEALAKIVDADPDKKSVMRQITKPGAGSGTVQLPAKEEAKTDGVYGVGRIRASLDKK